QLAHRDIAFKPGKLRGRRRPVDLAVGRCRARCRGRRRVAQLRFATHPLSAYPWRRVQQRIFWILLVLDWSTHYSTPPCSTAPVDAPCPVAVGSFSALLAPLLMSQRFAPTRLAASVAGGSDRAG